MGTVGFVTLERGAATLKEFVDQDEALQNLTDRVHLNIIQLRRFEKDYFLNIGNPEKQQEYLKKFQEIDAALPQLLGNVATLARADVHLPPDFQAKAAALPGLYADYRNGFYDTVRRLKADPNLTPQQANVLMAKFKADIPILETDMAAVAEAVDRMEISASAQAVNAPGTPGWLSPWGCWPPWCWAACWARPSAAPSTGPSSWKEYAAWPTGYDAPGLHPETKPAAWYHPYFPVI